MFLNISQNSQEAPVVEYHFDKVALLKPATLLKKWFQQIFTISLSKFFRPAIFENTTEWLLWRMSTNCKLSFVQVPKLDKLAVTHTPLTNNFTAKICGTPQKSLSAQSIFLLKPKPNLSSRKIFPIFWIFFSHLVISNHSMSVTETSSYTLWNFLHTSWLFLQ